jgi:hypothetical protein
VGDRGKRATRSAAERRRELGRRGKEGERAAALRGLREGAGVRVGPDELLGPRRRKGRRSWAGFLGLSFFLFFSFLLFQKNSNHLNSKLNLNLTHTQSIKLCTSMNAQSS